jgi:tetratricopeptide (TPR) repeat protein
MSMSRFFKNNIFYLTQVKNFKPYKPFIHAASTMTSSVTIPSSFTSVISTNVPKINTIDLMKKLTELVSSFQIVNDDDVRSDLNKTAHDCLKKSLDVVKNTYTEKKYSLATDQILRLVDTFENIYGDVSQSNSQPLRNLAFEIYTYQGKICEFGSLDQAEIAMEAFKKALQIDPNNQTARENYESLGLGLGLIDINQEMPDFKPKI